MPTISGEYPASTEQWEGARLAMTGPSPSVAITTWKLTDMVTSLSSG